MPKGRNYADNTRCRDAAMLTWELDSSLLDLLCEDGFLAPGELPEEDSSAARLALLRRAIHRGFLEEDRDEAAEADMLLAKQLDSLRVWTDLVDEDVHLRAPPLYG